MTITAPDLTGTDAPPDDTVVVTCARCERTQRVSGRAGGYTCSGCGTEWQVLKCRDCRRASIVVSGVATCPRCGRDHATPAAPEHPRSWLTEPDPLSVWLGSVKYLGGLAAPVDPGGPAGLLLDRRGIHLRAFAELCSIPWDTVAGLEIEGPVEIAERLSHARLRQLGASTWILQVSYLTVRTRDGDAIFEIDGLAPPHLHARLSRVLQGLRRATPAPSALDIERPSTGAAERATAPVPPAAPDAPVARVAPAAPKALDPERTNAPLEAVVIDALWKLGRLREQGLVDEDDVRILRDRLLAQVPDLAARVERRDPAAGGPLLRV